MYKQFYYILNKIFKIIILLIYIHKNLLEIKSTKLHTINFMYTIYIHIFNYHFSNKSFASLIFAAIYGDPPRSG